MSLTSSQIKSHLFSESLGGLQTIDFLKKEMYLIQNICMEALCALEKQMHNSIISMILLPLLRFRTDQVSRSVRV